MMQPTAAALLSLTGLWTGSFQAPDADHPTTIEVQIVTHAITGELRGSAAVEQDHSPFSGSLEEASGELRLATDFDDEELILLSLKLDGEVTLRGTLSKGSLSLPLVLERTDEPAHFFHHPGFLRPDSMPVSVASSQLAPELATEVQSILLDELEGQNGLGAAVAVVRHDALLDVRCAGWEDLERDVPASAATRYRWASLAKPLTAVAALQLVDRGHLDLDADVRELVPEFPDKGHRITAHQLLAHQAGIVHYGRGLVRREATYEVAHPSADRILCLDRFGDSPLLFEPGTHFTYSTHGYMLLGALIERAGEGSYEEQVRRRILDPLGMETMEPDYPWHEIPHRAVGYRGLRIGLATLDPERDVGWKLPAGGWISTIEDLGRFASGLLGDELLDLETRRNMFTSKVPSSGRNPYYGYGIGTRTIDGVEVLTHSGNQSMASTYLLLCPELDLGIAVLSNTANFSSRRLAERLFETLHDQ